MQEEQVQRTFHEQVESFHFQVDGLKDGYRVTFRSDEESIKENRRVGAAAVNLARQAEKAGWKLPWPIRMLLWFWDKYKITEGNK